MLSRVTQKGFDTIGMGGESPADRGYFYKIGARANNTYNFKLFHGLYFHLTFFILILIVDQQKLISVLPAAMEQGKAGEPTGAFQPIQALIPLIGIAFHFDFCWFYLSREIL
jgi:hypothetical protein